ncbi:MAG: hypothetical protein V4622_10840 [Bacteroidota bacterium]
MKFKLYILILFTSFKLNSQENIDTLFSQYEVVNFEDVYMSNIINPIMFEGNIIPFFTNDSLLKSTFGKPSIIREINCGDIHYYPYDCQNKRDTVFYYQYSFANFEIEKLNISSFVRDADKNIQTYMFSFTENNSLILAGHLINQDTKIEEFGQYFPNAYRNFLNRMNKLNVDFSKEGNYTFFLRTNIYENWQTESARELIISTKSNYKWEMDAHMSSSHWEFRFYKGKLIYIKNVIGT